VFSVAAVSRPTLRTGLVAQCLGGAIGGRVDTSPTEETSTGVPAPDGGSRVKETAAPTGTPFYINPDVFDFRPLPGTVNWQETGCVKIVFGYGSPFLPMIQINVGVRVGAPITLADGHRISLREAQLDAANAAQAAAGIITAMLDEGGIVPSEIQPRFTGFMGGAIMATGLGYRVNGCTPS
jgi:hypothetical protein